MIEFSESITRMNFDLVVLVEDKERAEVVSQTWQVTAEPAEVNFPNLHDFGDISVKGIKFSTMHGDFFITSTGSGNIWVLEKGKYPFIRQDLQLSELQPSTGSTLFLG